MKKGLILLGMNVIGFLLNVCFHGNRTFKTPGGYIYYSWHNLKSFFFNWLLPLNKRERIVPIGQSITFAISS
jgi:hypothetical protein